MPTRHRRTGAVKENSRARARSETPQFTNSRTAPVSSHLPTPLICHCRNLEKYHLGNPSSLGLCTFLSSSPALQLWLPPSIPIIQLQIFATSFSSPTIQHHIFSSSRTASPLQLSTFSSTTKQSNPPPSDESHQIFARYISEGLSASWKQEG